MLFDNIVLYVKKFFVESVTFAEVEKLDSFNQILSTIAPIIFR
jgi:hypothetical protein